MFQIDSPLSDVEEKLVYRVIGCGITVHRELGPGFRERIYEKAFCLELEACGLRFDCQKEISVKYKHWEIPGQKVDLVVEGLVLVEIKAVSRLKELHRVQVRSYLKTMQLPIGLLLNFDAPTMRAGTRRVVLSDAAGRGRA